MNGSVPPLKGLGIQLGELKQSHLKKEEAVASSLSPLCSAVEMERENRLVPSTAGEVLQGTVLGVRACKTSRTSEEKTNENWPS